MAKGVYATDFRASWPQEITDEAKTRYLAGETASQIARALNGKYGTTLSRNAVIGRIARLGLTRSPEAARIAAQIHHRQAALTRQASEARRPMPKPTPRQHMSETARAKFGALPGESKPPIPVRVTGPAPASLGLRISDPGFRGCRWPISGEGHETKFCCAPRRDGRAYCDAHHPASVQSPVLGKRPTSARDLERSLRRYV